MRTIFAAWTLTTDTLRSEQLHNKNDIAYNLNNNREGENSITATESVW